MDEDPDKEEQGYQQSDLFIRFCLDKPETDEGGREKNETAEGYKAGTELVREAAEQRLEEGRDGHWEED